MQSGITANVAAKDNHPADVNLAANDVTNGANGGEINGIQIGSHIINLAGIGLEVIADGDASVNSQVA
ncbi:hypothetical protein D3C72_1035390 [compost metagenome]